VEWRQVRPREAASLMQGYGRPWWVGGGWALDLFLGRETRQHADLDVVVFRADQEHAFTYFEGWDLRIAHQGELTPWRGERLELPVHTVWGRSSTDGLWELELFLMESDGSRWQFRRDPQITLELERVGLDRDGIPYLAPEIALLYKAKEPRSYDEADFAAVVDELPDERRE
jgi:aminoglycoside-2''-adenylyltransferase